jgi:hypothetical protein
LSRVAAAFGRSPRRERGGTAKRHRRFPLQLSAVGADVPRVRDVSVVRWRRYGHDRIYVTAADGTKLGWHDLMNGDDHIEVAEQTDAFRAAVAAWKRNAASS